MPTNTTGRRIGKNGLPMDGTGFSYDTDGPLPDLFRQRVSPLISQPITGEWAFALVLSSQTHGEYERGVGIFPPGNTGPPEHFHPSYDEHFMVLLGEFIFKIGGRVRRSRAGEKLVIPKGTPHSFRCVGDRHGVLIVETRPAARIGEVITALFGMAQEGALTSKGRPKFMQAMVIASEYADDTVFTHPPPQIAISISKALAPIARMIGYRPTDPKYLEESYWASQVEQPSRNV